MELIKPFNQLGKNDADIAGGKGASLGEMTQAGIPVPPGFVILADAFERFIIETELIAEIDAILEKVDHHEMHTVEHASETIQGLILHAQMPQDLRTEIENSFKELNTEFVAVRSSATAEDGAEAAWAGQLDTFLNTTHDTLLQKVQECWASLFTPRAIFYRFEKEMGAQKISVAVVVQKMVNSDAAGIAFSVHPVTEDYNQMIIEAGFGLGEAVVSGQVTPDSYIVTKEPVEIIEESISEQSQALYRKEGGGNEWKDLSHEKGSSQVLTKEQIYSLATVLMRIENHYGFPVDTEWAMENDELYIVQSRPITTLSPRSDVSVNSGSLNATRDQEKKTNNLKPFSAEDYRFTGLWKGNLLGDWFWTTWLVPELAEKVNLPMNDGGILVMDGGQFFVKHATLAAVRNYIQKILLKNDEATVQKLTEMADSVYKTSLDRLTELQTQEISAENVKEVFLLGQKIMFPWCFGYLLSEVIDEFLVAEATLAGIPLENISGMLPHFVTPLMQSQDEQRQIKKILIAKGYWNLLLEDSSKAIKTIKDDAEVFEMIEKYRTTYAWLPIFNLLYEELTIENILLQLAGLADEPKRDSHTIPPSMALIMKAASAVAYLRQTGAEYFSIYSYQAIPVFEKTSRKLGIAYTEMLNLVLEDVLAGFAGTNVKEISDRRADDTWAISSDSNGIPNVLDDAGVVKGLVDAMVPKAETDSSNEIKGQVGNKGKTTGRVKVVFVSQEFSKIEEGDILVTTMTTPDFLPMMQKASAIVTDIGGLLCHAAIISREMNKPCVIGTKFATQILKDGDMVEVDADKGIVRILSTVTNQKKSSSSSSLTKKYLEAMGDDEIFKIEGDFIPLLVLVDWFNYRDQKGNIQNLYPAIFFKNDATVNLYWSLTKYRQVSKEFFQAYLKGTLTLPEYQKTYDTLKSSIDDAYTSYYTHPAKNESELLARLETAHNLLREIDLVALFLDALDQKIIKETLEEEGKSIDLSNVWRISHILDTYSFHIKNKEEIIAQHKKLPESLQYVYSNYVQILSLEETLKTVSTADVEQLKKEVEENKVEAAKNAEHKRMEAATLTELEQKVLTFIDYSAALRDDRKALITKCDVMLFNFVSDLYKLWGIPAELVGVSLVMDVLKGKEYVEGMAPLLQERLSKMSIYLTGAHEYEESDTETLEEVEAAYHRQHAPEDITSLKGETASRGFVRGTVRVIIKQQDFHTFQEGEVLVAAMTRPEFVPLMKKAAAIVTDEGGITSHAAIVSRELGKPCVIGTRVATQVLHDGDEVEVDADNGIIRILSTAKKHEEVERWDLSIQRNFPPFAISTSTHVEWKGFEMGPLQWKRGREIAIRINDEHMNCFMNPSEFYVSNIEEVLASINTTFEKTLDENNALIHEGVRVNPGESKKDLEKLNQVHTLMYVLMLIGYDIAGDIKAAIERTTPLTPELETYLSITTGETAVERERRAVQAAREGKGNAKDLAKEFGYLHQDYLGKPWTEKDYEIALQQTPVKGPEAESFNLDSYTPHEQWLISLFKKNLYLYEEGRNGMVRAAWAMKETMSVLGEDPEKLLYMTLDEVTGYADGSKKAISDEMYATRKKAYGVYFEGDTFVEVEGVDAVNKIIEDQRLEKFLEKKEFGNVTELKGRIAFKGYAKGKVRLVFTQADADFVEEGDILVSPMTQVEFLSGLRRCGAIVTDEGGIVCHAAIVAREFSKPCLLATKDATKVLKNGDIVEVDAELGIVRILQKTYA